METQFNNTQKTLLEEAKKKGFILVEEFEKYYTSPITIKANIRRFIALGFLKESTTPGKFEYTGKRKWI